MFDLIFKFLSNPIVTAIIGAILGTMGRFIDAIGIRPLFEYYEIRKNVVRVFHDHAGAITSPGTLNFQEINDIQREIRGVAREINVIYSTFKLYKLFEILKLIPPKKKLINGHGFIIRISNCLHEPSYALQNFQDMNKVEELLGLK